MRTAFATVAALAGTLVHLAPSVAASVCQPEPSRQVCAHSVEHTTSGSRIFLRRGYPNELTSYARTVRLTIVRDMMGRAVEVKVERDDCYTIGPDCRRRVYREAKQMTLAVDAFAREVYMPDRTVEITRDEVTRRIPLSDLLDERRIVDPFFHQDHREFGWTHNAHELIVEAK